MRLDNDDVWRGLGGCRDSSIRSLSCSDAKAEQTEKAALTPPGYLAAACNEQLQLPTGSGAG